MRLAKNAFLTTLVMLALLVTVSAQTLRSEEDPRNIAPTVGTGGPPGGPTGLFTVYDGQTLRRGEFTFSIAYSNFDRDPGNVDIVEVPVSFQIGLSDHLELFFNTDAYRQIKVNSPQNLSSFYLPNSRINGVSPAAIVACPRGPGTATVVGACYRPAGTAVFATFPYVGASTGNFGFPFFAGNQVQIGTLFGFAANATPTIGPFQGDGGNGADFFPGIGSIYGSILPGIVLTTTPAGTPAGGGGATNPQVYTLQPSYLPDAPFINRTYGTSSFNTFTIGAKIRFTSPESATGFGIIPFYRFYGDQADDNFNMLQRGASPGGGGWNPFSGNRGDIGMMLFLDSRLRKWVNLSLNAGYIWNSSVKAEIGGNEFTLLDRGDEFSYAVGLDFPVNKYFQPILEFRQTRYVGGRTPNAFENDPMDGIGGIRVFPARWWGFGLAYRHHFNQQDRGSVSEVGFNRNVQTRVATFGTGAQTGAITGVTVGSVTSSGTIGSAFTPSNDPHGFIFQIFAGHRNARGAANVLNQPANVTALDLDRTTITLPCPPNTRSASGCGDVQSVGVRTTAVDPEGDVLTYSYTVSGGRITGQGANVTWDLSGVRAGTYTITSAVDDGCGFCGTPRTSTITVAECTDCVPIPPPCTCPTVSVSVSPQQAEPGSPITFTANVSGGTNTGVTYNWRVSQGTIESGQGTPVITVSTAGLQNTSVTATVDVSVTPDCPCPGLSASETASVAGLPDVQLVEEFTGTENRDQTRARVDNFWVALQNNPNARGVILLYGTDREVKTREAQLREAFQFRGYPLDRVEFRRGGTDPGLRTRFFIVPPGAPDPQP